MSKFIGWVAIAQLAAAAAPAVAQPSESEVTSARWHLDGATSRCILTRPLAGTPVPANFILRTLPGSGRYEIILASRAFPEALLRLRSRQIVTLTLGPDGPSAVVPIGAIDLPETLGEGLAIGPLSAELLTVFAGASSLAVGDDGREIARWTVPAAARAAEAVAFCEAEKLAEWGADPAGLAAGSTRAKPAGDPAGWLTPRQLGLHDTLASLAYTGVFRLAVGVDGRVAECTLMESAGNVDLSRGCRILTQVARYAPAQDPTGSPVRSVVIHVVDVRSRTDIRIIGGS